MEPIETDSKKLDAPKRFYRSGSEGWIILVRSGRETSTVYKHCYKKGKVSVVTNRTVHFLSMFVLNVSNVGHPA
jgi:hypothetical protein